MTWRWQLAASLLPADVSSLFVASLRAPLSSLLLLLLILLLRLLRAVSSAQLTMPSATPSRPMGYVCYEALMKNFPFDKRQQLAGMSSQLRTLNRKLPFVLNSVRYSDDRASIDQHTHERLLRDPGDKYITFEIDSYQWHFKVCNNYIVMMIPTGRVFRISCSEQIVGDLINFFLDRPGTVIKHLKIVNHDGFLPFTFNHVPEVSFLNLTINNHCHSGFLTSIASNHFKQVIIKDRSQRIDFVAELPVFCVNQTVRTEDLQNMKADRLNLWFLRQSLGKRFPTFATKTLTIREETAQPSRFANLCRQFKNGVYGLESSYEGYYRASRHFNEKRYWDGIKNRLSCEEKYLDGGKCLSTLIQNTNAELNIKIQKMARNRTPYLLSAHFATVGTAKRQSELGFIEFIWIMILAIWMKIKIAFFRLNSRLIADFFLSPPRHHSIFIVFCTYVSLGSYFTNPYWFSVIMIHCFLRIWLWVLITPSIARFEPFFDRWAGRSIFLPSSRSAGCILHIFALLVNLLLIGVWVGMFFPDETFYRYGLTEKYFILYELIIFF